MFSPLSILKRNFDIPSKLENDNKSINIDRLNSFMTETNKISENSKKKIMIKI